MNSRFAHLHVHSHFSLLDSTIQLEDLVDTAVQDKMEAIALTDNGNLFAALEFYSLAKERGIKPILGCELYLAPQSRFIKGTHTGGDDELPPYAPLRSGLHHLNLLVMNEVGYQNLCRLVSSGYLEGFYYKPRIDKEILAECAEGLIATSSCMKGEVSHLAIIGDMDRAREAAIWYRDHFPGRFYLEMQQNGLPQQMVLNQRFQELSQELGIPLIATADCHYLKREDAFSQEVLMAIQTGSVIEDTSGGSVRSDEFYFKPQAVMEEEFAFCPEAVANTIEIAKRCEFEFKFYDENKKKIYHFPKFDPPEGKTQVDYLNERAEQGLKKRLYESEAIHKRTITDADREQYKARLKKELDVINQMGFAGYFLIVMDFIEYGKTHDIPVGPGRGSGAGSLVAYSLGITELDPIEHGLLFERFLNPERISLPDFDVDFCMDKRDKVIEYVSQKYGKDCVAQIITFGKLQARGVIRDVGRSFGFTPPEMDRVAKLVPETLNITLEEALEKEPRLRQLTETDPKMSQLIETCKKLEGLGRHASIHAAGLVISNQPMVKHCPLYRGKNDELVIQFDMNNADKIGLIKFDFLGLKTLTFLQAAEDLINQRHPESHFQLTQIDLKDKPMYEMLTRGDTLGIFQLESSGMQDLMKKVRPDEFTDIVASNALYRPGPLESGMVDDFINRKHGNTPVIYDFDELRPVLQETYGVIVYQEQVQQIAMRLASYTAGGADLLRRAMGKKKPEEMAKQKEIFVSGAVKNGFNQVKIEKLFDLMEKFAGYGFNKSHAAAYSLITCQTAFIKAHYTVEFFATLLSIERENTDKITKYIADAARHGIKVLPPDINESDIDFTVLSLKEIRFGLGAIKGVGEIAIREVLEARKKEKFTDLFDLCARTSNRVVNKRVLEAFTKSGAMDSFKQHRASIIKTLDKAIDQGSQLQKQLDENQSSFLDLLGEEANTMAPRNVTYEYEENWPRNIELKYEKDTIGFFVSGHPLDQFAKEIEKFTSNTLESLQQPGTSKEIRIAAHVASLREIITKRGDRMAFATLEDRTDQIDCVIFSDVFLETEALWKGEEPLWIKGQVELSEGGAKVILSKKSNAKVAQLQYAYEQLAREVHLHLKMDEIADDTDKFGKFFNFTRSQTVPNSQGSYFIHLRMGDLPESVYHLRGQFTIRREIIDFAKNLWGGALEDIGYL